MSNYFCACTEYQESAKAAIAMSQILPDHLCVIERVIQTVSLLIIQILVLRKTEFSKLRLSQQQILIFPILFVYIYMTSFSPTGKFHNRVFKKLTP